MKRFWKWLRSHGRQVALWGSGALLSSGLLLTHLGSLTHGLSQREVLVNQQTSSLSTIVHNPVGLPLNLLQWLTGLLPFHNDFWLRVPSAIIALSAVAALTYLMRRWYGPRTATFGFFLFVASAWLLHTGRLATEDILFVWALPLLLVSHSLLHDFPKKSAAFYFWVAVQITLLYIPGMVWFVLLNILLQRIDILASLKARKSWLSHLGAVAITLLLVSPLLYAVVMGSARSIGLELIGIPASLPHWQTMLHNLRDALLFVAIRGHAPNDVWLNHLPLLDAFLTLTFITGAYFYSKHWRASRTTLLISFFLLSLVLLALGGSVTIGVLVPLLYLVAAAGIAYLLHLWLVVFPRNPLARGFGIFLVGIVVAFSCLYGMRQYFVAWPHHPETRTVFASHKIEPSRR